MTRASVVLVFVASGLVACATISGLADKEAVDCPGCEDTIDLPDARNTSSSSGGSSSGSSGEVDTGVVDTGPPKCDPATDAQCMPLPAGWALVARTPIIGNGAPPACPSGMTKPSTAGEQPSAQGNSCSCDSCTVTAQATCSGKLTYTFGMLNVCDQTGDPLDYSNTVAGQCYTDVYHGAWLAEVNKFVLPQPTGGACTANPTAVAHSDRVSYGARSLLCDDTSRCSGGVCDARIDAPFSVCVAQNGDVACPAGFADKHVTGTTGADFDCGTCSSCTVNRAPCQGAVYHYSDGNCTLDQLIIPANGLCGGPNTGGADLDSYKVVATSNTTCSATGSATATNPRLKSPRTVCCR